jgi:hypothetical protein
MVHAKVADKESLVEAVPIPVTLCIATAFVITLVVTLVISRSVAVAVALFTPSIAICLMVATWSLSLIGVTAISRRCGVEPDR